MIYKIYANITNQCLIHVTWALHPKIWFRYPSSAVVKFPVHRTTIRAKPIISHKRVMHGIKSGCTSQIPTNLINWFVYSYYNVMASISRNLYNTESSDFVYLQTTSYTQRSRRCKSYFGCCDKTIFYLVSMTVLRIGHWLGNWYQLTWKSQRHRSRLLILCWE